MIVLRNMQRLAFLSLLVVGTAAAYGAENQSETSGHMKRYVIERNVPGIGANDQAGLSAIARQSNDALAKLGPHIQWVESYIAGDKTFCVYLADSEAVIREHARLSGFPANVITEIDAVIDPATAK
jgi:hypothetical protein